MAFDRLFEPLQVGPLELRNRVIFGAHFTMFTEPSPTFGEPGYFGRRYGRYLAERAAGGVAAVIAGETAVAPNTAYKMVNNAVGWDPSAVPHFEALTSQVHEHGAKAFIQLTHSGAMMLGNWSKQVAVAPSVTPDYFEAPKAMDARDIAEMIDYHVRCARNAVAGGFDGIEIQSAHGYLLHQFLSPHFNYRSDEYGGSLENRMRFGVQVLTAVREAVDGKLAVGLRLAGDDEVSHGPGLTADDCAEAAARYEELGLVDYLNVSIGTGGIGMVRTNYSPHLFGVYAAHAIKKAVDHTPVFTVHRILTPDEAEGILERHEADGVTLVRALIADPDWVNKAREGRDEQIRRCTGINQSCYGNLLQSMPINCVQNPAVGREDELGAGTLTPAAKAKKVVVVGGGPGGLEAAWVAAARGHDVTLLERSDQLGGAIRLAQMLPGRHEIADLADWRIGECERRGVDIRLGTEATVESIVALAPDAVIVATGGRATKEGRSAYHPMPVPGSEQDWVYDHVAALQARARRPRLARLAHRAARRGRSRPGRRPRRAARVTGPRGDRRLPAAAAHGRRRRDPGRGAPPRGAGRHGLAAQHGDDLDRRPRGDGHRGALAPDRDDHRRRLGRDPHPRAAQRRAVLRPPGADARERGSRGRQHRRRGRRPPGRPRRLRRSRRGAGAVSGAPAERVFGLL